MSAFTLMQSSAVLLVFLPVRLDVARTSRPKMTTASSWVNTDILVLDNRSNVFFGMLIPSPRDIYLNNSKIQNNQCTCVRINDINGGYIIYTHAKIETCLFRILQLIKDNFQKLFEVHLQISFGKMFKQYLAFETT